MTEPLTVTALNRRIRVHLEHDIGAVAVTGEISNLAQPSSGHLYFTLKDAAAQIRCVFFKSHHKSQHHTLVDGQHVILHGVLTVYEARGDYQLLVSHLTQAGIGELYQQFEKLKNTLAAQGLFDIIHKKPIPRFPTSIAVITSQTGAAIRDVLTTLARRYPLATVRIYPSDVQGKEAPAQLIAALQKVHQDAEASVILLVRGGGSIEDLWAFNDPKLAMAIFHSTIPIIAGIGHETDFTIADFVADHRAATPTAAAETATPDAHALLHTMTQYIARLTHAAHRQLAYQKALLARHQAGLSSPQTRILLALQRVDMLTLQLNNVMMNRLKTLNNQVSQSISVLDKHHPLTQLTSLKQQCQHYVDALTRQIRYTVDTANTRLSHAATVLAALNPLATLSRGYAIATHNHHVIYHSADVSLGDTLSLKLFKGTLHCEVIDKEEDSHV